MGDSASLAYLQLIRMIVETRTGPNTFTMDPNRHKIMESSITLPPKMTRTPQLLPDRETARVLVDSFFTHVSRGLSCPGTGQILPRQSQAQDCRR